MSFCTIVFYINNLNYLNIIADGALYSMYDRIIQFKIYNNDFNVLYKIGKFQITNGNDLNKKLLRLEKVIV